MRATLIVAGLAMLAACAPQDGTRPETTPAPGPVATGPDSCGATKVSSYVGTQATDEALAKIKSASGTKSMRVAGPNDMMTQDFRQDRLTIITDENGRIKTLSCV
jgi:uncharacterized lipoprotein YajG